MESPNRRLRAVLRHVATAAGAAEVPGNVDGEAEAGALGKLPAGISAALDPCGLLRTPWAHRHIRWMAQKDAIGQDMFLIGATGPMRRWLALRFAEATGREVEVVPLTQDTTESDLKQRREIGAGGSVRHSDQAVVQAALHGRLLVLEGLEKVERNVLPVVNNLLENREMQLDDGRFLVAPQRYDALLASHGPAHLKALRLERVSPHFRVIAVGVPVPPFPGNPLDPPLRSRFQARRVDRMPAGLLLRCLAGQGSGAAVNAGVRRQVGERVAGTQAAEAGLQELIAAYEAVWELGAAQGAASGGESREIAYERLLYPSEPAMASAARVLQQVPGTSAADAVHRILPALHAARDTETRALLERVLPAASFGLASPTPGEGPLAHLAGWQAALALRMRGSLTVCSNVLLIGARGAGKSTVVRALLASEGYEPVETLMLYKDMTSRDLLQSRATTPQGETIWRDSCVARAARLGRAVILDGVDRLAPGVLGALARLLEDREAVLFDGTHLVSSSRLDALAASLHLTPAQLAAQHRVEAVHPRFRVVALAAPPDVKNPWLTNELAHSFHFFALSDASADSPAEAAADLLRQVAKSGTPALAAEPGLIERLCDLSVRLAAVSSDGGTPIAELSLRQMLRLLRRALRYPGDVPSRVADALLVDFLPASERVAVQGVLGPWPGPPVPASGTAEILLDEAAGQLRIGTTACPLGRPEHPALVPDVRFFDIPMHTHLLESMLRDFVLGEHLLLIGNQGVGKNKLADRLLQLLRREREYVQLHRDTTVQALTLLPSLRGGVVTYEDSPLVKALEHGHVLVVDEFDKAPAEVVCILKGLLEDGEVLLADGRRFVDARRSSLAVEAFTGEERERIRQIDPGFRMLALANRPGFPFLGNDFFREMGDVFAVHAVGNPDHASEIAMLQGYAPRVPQPLIERLVLAFGELRSMADEGLVSYPYSTREVVNVVRHLDRFPRDSITEVVENVFGFDFDPDLRSQLCDVFRRHGIPVARSGGAAWGGTPEAKDGSATADERTCLAPELAVLDSFPTHQLSLAPGKEAIAAVSSAAPAKRWELGRLQHRVERVQDADRWRPLESAASARVGRFSEEIVGWRTGGAEPVALAALRSSVFVLQAQELRHFDLHSMRWRTHDLRLARLVPGRYRGLAAAGEWVLAYGEHEHVAQLLQPFAEPPLEAVPVRLEPFAGVPEPGGRVEVLAAPGALAPCFVLYGIGSQHLLLLCPRTQQVRAVELPPTVAPRGLAAVEALGGDLGRVVFLLRPLGQTARVWRLTLAVAPVLQGRGASVLEGVDGTARLECLQVSAVMGAEDSGLLPPVLGSVMAETGGTSAASDRVCHATGGAGEVVAGVAEGLLAGQAAVAFAALRPVGADLMLYCDGATTPPFLRKRRTFAWLAEAGLACTVTSSPLAVMVDAVSIVGRSQWEGRGAPAAVCRCVALARQPQDLFPFVVPPEHRTDANFLRGNGMPHAIQAVEVPGEGTLAVLLADGQIRVLELRRRRLADDHALWRQMVDGTSAIAMGLPDGDDDDQDALAGTGAGRSHLGTRSDGSITRGSEGQAQPGASKGDGEGSGQAQPGASKGDGEGSGQGEGGGSGRGVGGGSSAAASGGGGTGISFDPDAVHQGPRPGAGAALSAQPTVDAEELARLDREGEQALRKAREKAWQAVGEQRTRGARLVGPWDELQYGRIYNSVQREISQLRVVLAAAEAKEHERTWLRNQSHGELDDARLVDGVTGERSIFRRRGQQDPIFGRVQRLPKRLSFVVDVSSSMARMNGDGRLDRLAATAVTVMEALAGFEARFCYSIVGHSGETEALDLVAKGRPPRDAKERLEVVRNMYAHAGGAMSGDSTLPATLRAIREVAAEEADDRFVFVVSDANLAQYGVHPKVMARALQEDVRVNTYVFFIAGTEQAEEVRRVAPPGRVFTILDTRELPVIFRRIFAAAVLRDV